MKFLPFASVVTCLAALPALGQTRPAASDAANMPTAAQSALTPIEMFLHADFVVKGVMLGLLAASVLVWTIWLVKVAQIMWAGWSLRLALRQLTAGFTVRGATGLPGVANRMLKAAQGEAALSAGLSRDGTLERAASELAAIGAATQRRLQRGVAVIGTVASTAPFVGLFGTVWGIMNSFTGIAATKTTNLAVVAPGIAEALLATGIGLIAAIPALVLYNHLARLLAAHRAALTEASRRIGAALSRDLDRGEAARQPDARILHLARE